VQHSQGIASSSSPPTRAHPGWWQLLTLAIYQLVFSIGFLFYTPVLAWRMLFDRRYCKGLSERTGRVAFAHADRDVIWIHGVSIGEIKAAANIIACLRRLRPELQLVLSSTTPNGHLVARKENPDLPVVFYPLDFAGFPARALDRVRPRCVLLMELEIWPNFLLAAARRGIPVAVINGRISQRTFRGYRLARVLLPQLDLISIYCVQDAAYRQRLIDLGIDPRRVHVTGNMKYDSVVMGAHAERREELRRWLAVDDRPVLVAGSTHADEEQWVVAAVDAAAATLGRPVRVVLVPRHPERAAGVSDVVVGCGHQVVRWSTLSARLPVLGDGTVLLVDTIGQLQQFYSACDVAFVGGSLVHHGGQNMLEPAAQGRAVLFGPHTENFRADVDLLLNAGAAIQVRDRVDLAHKLRELLDSPGRRETIGRLARQVITENQGATGRTLDLVAPLLGQARSGSG